MNTGNNIFRDYCKAENSDDEEHYSNLQASLYAQIYYAPDPRDEHLSKAVVSDEESSLANNRLCTNGSSNQETNQTTHIKHFQGSLHAADKQIVAKDNISSSVGTTLSQDPNLNITQNEADIAIKGKEKSSLAPAENNVAKLKTDKGSNKPECQRKKLKSSNIGPPSNDSSSISKSLSDTSKPKLKAVSNQHSSEKTVPQWVSETNIVESRDLDSQSSTNVSGKTGNKTQGTRIMQEPNSRPETSPAPSSKKIVKENRVPPNLLKKYDFSKRFINKLYDEKFRELEKRLQECEAVEEPNESNEADEINAINETNKSHKSDEVEMDTRYAVLEKNDKNKQKNKRIIQLTDPKNDSDSDESIFEVPLPPKPLPPLINLHDSDEEPECNNSSSSDESDLSCNDSSNAKNSQKKSTVSASAKRNDKDTDTVSKRLDHNTRGEAESTATSHVPELEESNEDIILNCTEIQKGAATLNEIKQMSKNVQNEQNFSIAQTMATQSKLTENQCNKSVDETQEQPVLDNNTWSGTAFPECMSFGDDTSWAFYEDELLDSEVAPPIDLVATNIDFTDDNSVLELNITSLKDLVTVNRKRHHSEVQRKAQAVTSGVMHNHSEDLITSVMEPNITNPKNTDNQAFTEIPQLGPSHPPMSDALKSFYNDPRPHRNFNLGEMQSKMSKDPRMWAILDADLMPSPSKRQRFWNIRCTHCHRDGHVRYNCPEPRRPSRCHMCGIQGHTESRCPQKMCLTCGKKQGSFRKTCESCRTFFCTTCNAIGHKAKECPDLWRRYHQTTKTSQLQVPQNLTDVMKPANRLFCCNCTKRGHDSSTCREYRWSQHFPTPAHVSNYMTGPKYTEDIDNNVTRNLTQHNVPQNQTTQTMQVVQNTPVEVSPSGKNQPTTSNPNFIPLLELNESEDSQFDTLLFTAEQLEGAIYKCGVYNGPIVKKYTATFQVGNMKGAYIEGVQQRLIFPTFLEKLVNTVSFRAVVYNKRNGILMATIRSPVLQPKPLQKLVYQWSTVPDIEKNARICTDLPFNKSELLKFMTAEFAKMQATTGDPANLRQVIDSIKMSLKPGTCTADVPHILRIQSQLNMVIHSKPKESTTVTRLRRDLAKLEATPGSDLPLLSYLNILFMYNQIFAPYTMTKVDELVRKVNARIYQLQREEDIARNPQAKKKRPVVNAQAGRKSKKHKGGQSEKGQTNFQPNYIHPPITNEPPFQPYTIPNMGNVYGGTMYTSFTDDAMGFSPPPPIPPPVIPPPLMPPHLMLPPVMPPPPMPPPLVPPPLIPPPLIPPPLILPPPIPSPDIPPPTIPLQSEDLSISEPAAMILDDIPLPPNVPLPRDLPPTVCVPSPLPPNVSVPPQLPPNVSVLPELPPNVSAPPELPDNVFIPPRLSQGPINSRRSKDVPQQPDVIECIDLVDEPEDDASKLVRIEFRKLKNTPDPWKIDLRHIQKKRFKKREEKAKSKIIQKAKRTVAEAYQFGLPHMDQAAREIDSKINSKAVTRKHIKTLRRLIMLEEMHKREVKDICSNLK